MLSQYFSLSLSPPGVVTGIPLLLKSYTPPLGKLPAFLLRVATEVDFKDEKKCFEGVSRELSAFYVPERLAPMREVDGEENEESGEVGKRREEISWLLEHVMFPAVRQRLVATRELLEKGAVVEVANLRGLYRVFERC
jgi:DNA mismatch repair protein MLH1